MAPAVLASLRPLPTFIVALVRVTSALAKLLAPSVLNCRLARPTSDVVPTPLTTNEPLPGDVFPRNTMPLFTVEGLNVKVLPLVMLRPASRKYSLM